MSVVTISGSVYYIVTKELVGKYPVLFDKCSTTRTMVNVITKRSLDPGWYIWMNSSRGVVTVCTTATKNKGSKLCLLKSYVDSNFIEVAEVRPKYDPAPEILDLDDSEKFQGPEGVIEIETRGSREPGGLWFKAKDVGKAFDLVAIVESIIERQEFTRDIDYKTFSVITNPQGVTTQIVINPRRMFLSYQGLRRVIESSRKQAAKDYLKWCNETLFNLQFDVEQDKKDEIAAKALNVNKKDIARVFRSHASSFPCIYLLKLPKMKDLTTHFKFSEGDLEKYSELPVYKYGFSTDFSKRLSKYQSDYKFEYTIEAHHYIDSVYCSKAESNIKNLCESLGITLQVENKKELIVIPSKPVLNSITEQFTLLGKSYAGCTRESQAKIDDLECQLKLKDKDIEIAQLQYENELCDLRGQLNVKKLEVTYLKSQVGTRTRIRLRKIEDNLSSRS